MGMAFSRKKKCQKIWEYYTKLSPFWKLRKKGVKKGAKQSKTTNKSTCT